MGSWNMLRFLFEDPQILYLDKKLELKMCKLGHMDELRMSFIVTSKYPCFNSTSWMQKCAWTDFLWGGKCNGDIEINGWLPGVRDGRWVWCESWYKEIGALRWGACDTAVLYLDGGSDNRNLHGWLHTAVST